MELDPRIIKGKTYLDCYDTEIAKQFIGKKGYFSHYIDNYADLKNTVLGTLGSTGDTFHESFCCTEQPFDNYYYEFFIPEDWVEEPKKKYRPFTPDEFTDTFTIGEPIIFRRKQSKRVYEYNVLFIGCCFSGDNTDVVLGNDRFSLETLFNNYEWRQHGSYEWKPFGVLVEEDE